MVITRGFRRGLVYRQIICYKIKTFLFEKGIFSGSKSGEKEFFIGTIRELLESLCQTMATADDGDTGNCLYDHF